jgi:hypothetical protein
VGADLTDDRTGLTVVAGPPDQTVSLPPIAIGTSDRRVLLIGIEGAAGGTRISGPDSPMLHRLIATGTYATAHASAAPAACDDRSPARHGPLSAPYQRQIEAVAALFGRCWPPYVADPRTTRRTGLGS